MKDFLRLELKFSEREGTDHLYLHFDSEELSRYIFRKTSQVKNENFGAAQFIHLNSSKDIMNYPDLHLLKGKRMKS